MNEDGNNFAPQGPIFSSPDTPPANPNPAPAPQAPVTPAPAPAPTPAPEQPTYTNPFATTEISTEPTAPTAPIVSTPQEPANNTRHMFNSRRFKDTQAQAAPTQFAGAPDFFNQAAAQNAPSTGDIVIGDQPQRSGGKGKMIAVVAAILLLAGGAVAAALLIPQGGGSNGGGSGSGSSNTSAGFSEKIKTFYEKYADVLVSQSNIETIINDEENREGKIIKDGKTFFIMRSYVIDEMNDAISAAKDAKNSLDEAVNANNPNENEQAYLAIKEKIEITINTLSENVDVLDKFDKAFAAPLYELVKKGEASESCSLGEGGDELLSSDSSTISNAAKQYKTAFCNISREVRAKTFSNTYLREDVEAAKRAFIACLKQTEGKGASEEELKEIIPESNDE
jgi:hypothetical protein